MTEDMVDSVIEQQKQVPVIYDMDVVVVGGGLSGLFAALAAGRTGANTLVIDRFGTLGGNLGPAMLVGGSVADEAHNTLPGGLAGLAKELVSRMKALQAVNALDYADHSNIISYLAFTMAEEAGVKLLLSVWAADPILDGNRINGLFVEGKSGRSAVRAKVVIDASGEADIARRCGVPVVTEEAIDPSYVPVIQRHFLHQDYATWNDTGLWFVIANVDQDAFDQFAVSKVDLSEADKTWIEEQSQWARWGVGHRKLEFINPIVPLLRKAWDHGDYEFQRFLEPRVYAMCPFLGNLTSVRGLAGTRVNVGGQIRRDDIAQISRLESSARRFVFETVQFLRKYIPGYEECYLLFMAPYFGARGGPRIDGEYTLTPQDTLMGKRFDDTLFLNTHNRHKEGANPDGYDTPYRTMLPKGLDGLLVTGRASSYLRRGHDPGCTRARAALMELGEAAGVAAAMAVEDGVTPRNLDIKKLQRHLVKQGFNLGNPERLRELGIGS